MLASRQEPATEPQALALECLATYGGINGRRLTQLEGKKVPDIIEPKQLAGVLPMNLRH